MQMLLGQIAMAAVLLFAVVGGLQFGDCLFGMVEGGLQMLMRPP